MASKFKIIVLFFLTLMIGHASTKCTIRIIDIEHEWRVPIEYKGNTSDLLRHQNVEEGTVILWVCGDSQITEMVCQNGQFNIAFPLPGCSDRPRSIMLKENDRRICPFDLYKVGFQLQCRGTEFFFETYEICFDPKQMRTIFSINHAYPYVLKRPPFAQFDPDHLFTGYYFSLYNKRSIVSRFYELLGPQQNLMSPNEQERRFDRGHLVPVTDFMVNSLLMTTFKMINVIPQFHMINEGNWKQLEEWARNPENAPCSVCSGALDYVLKLPNAEGNLIPIYFGNNNLIPVPLWTYKIVTTGSNERYAFLQYNNIHDRNVPPPIPQGLCRSAQCPRRLSLNPSNLSGYTYCCDPEYFVKNVVPNLRGLC